mmetsp:Transcript_27434/g.38598  ORF Transcript_27434/g.38598 Transcript_27434/m.38598 type:complete len:455 (+) Transcript_27434:103-1467(+)
MTQVVSNAALATLTVADLQKDTLIALVVSIASSFQLKVVEKKKAPLSLTLLSEEVLTERNAILRALCGMVFHNALDNAPYYMLGGHSAASAVSQSPVSAMAMAGISSWMSVASKVRQSPSSEHDLIDQLDSYLKTRAYLVPSATPTVADLDLTLALLEQQSKGEVPLQSHHIHVRRWMEQCHATMTTMAEGSKVTIPPLEGETAPIPMPVFFYGTEENVVLPKAPTKEGGEKKSSDPQAASDGAQGGLSEEEKKAAAEKRAKKNAEKAAKKKKQPQPKQQEQQAAKDLDVSALDIRVGKIIKAWHHEEAEKLFCEEVDVGEESGPRKIASGLRPFYKTEDLTGRHVLVLCNLKARNLVGFPSHGMVMCASNDDHTKVEFVVPPPDAKIGERIIFDGYKGDPETENKVAKKKLFEKIAPDLKTDADGVVTWKTGKAMTSAGPVKALNGMPNAHVS